MILKPFYTIILSFLLSFYSTAQSDAQFFEDQGEEYYQSGQYFKAADSYKQAIKIEGLKSCVAYDLFKIYAQIDQYDTALYYWELLYSPRNSIMDLSNIEYFEHDAKDSIWDPIRDTEEWKSAYNRIREGYMSSLEDINWKYRDLFDSLYQVNQDLAADRLMILNQFGAESEEMKLFDRSVQAHRNYSIMQLTIVLDDVGYPMKEQLGKEAWRYFNQVISESSVEFLKLYWPLFEQAYLDDQLDEYFYQKWQSKIKDSSE